MLKFIKRALTLLVLLAVCACGYFVVQGHQMYQDALAQTPLTEKIAAITAQPEYTPCGQLPKIYLDAVIAVEDHRFYRHPGVDVIAIGRALWNDLKAGAMVEGGSTITQQLAKNLYFTQEKILTRKVAEVFMALDIEESYDKEEILSYYLNSIYFGSGYYCVYDASMGYFSKTPQAMNDYESTLLAGIPNAPSAYAPNKNPELAASRQRQVLSKMIKHGYLDQLQAEAILQQGEPAP